MINNYSSPISSFEPNKIETWYEKERRHFADQLFNSPSERHDFEYPLADWGHYCRENLDLHRRQYIVDSYQTTEMVKRTSLLQQTFTRADGQPIPIILWQGSIEKLEIDAIVNAANETLLGGGGVDQAIHSAAGHLLVKECAHIRGGCQVGEAKITKGYALPAHYVLHTVGPILMDNLYPDHEALKECYRSCLKICEEKGLETVAFPCISTGFYGFPLDQSADTVLSCLKEEIKQLRKVKTIILTLFSPEQVECYLNSFSHKE